MIINTDTRLNMAPILKINEYVLLTIKLWLKKYLL